MDIDNARKIQHSDEYAESRWEQLLREKRAEGVRLVSIEAVGYHLDDSTGNESIQGVRVSDFDTETVIRTYTLDEFNELEYTHEGWFGADHYYM